MNELQRTPDWFAARLGRLTGSRIADATARTAKGAWASSRDNYKAELVNERLTGLPIEHFINKAMQDGIDREPDAIVTYEFERNAVVELVGFVPHPRIAMAGCSPDGIVVGPEKIEKGWARRPRNIVSIKCPLIATHLATLKGAGISGAYLKQMQWEMACLPNAEWCDFVSYCPLMPTDLQIDIRRVERDDKLIAKLEEEGEEFLAEVAADHKWMLELAVARRAGRAQPSPLLGQLKASVEALGA